jgi:hypothetical protein
MLAILLVLLSETAQPDLPRQWAHFSRSVSLKHVDETVDIATGDMAGGADFRYILRLTTRSLGADPKVAWADSATCPAVRTVISTMRSIRMPSPAPYDWSDRSKAITLDGTRYSLTAPSSDDMGKLTIMATGDSALESWVNDSLKALAPCWRSKAP